MLRKLKTALTRFPKIADNAAAAFPTNLLRESASLFSYFFTVYSSFAGEFTEAAGFPAKVPAISSAIVAIIKERAVSTDVVARPCTRNEVRVLSTKDASLVRTFLMVCLILATCV